MCVRRACQVTPLMSDSVRPRALWPARLLCPGVLQPRVLQRVAMPSSSRARATDEKHLSCSSWEGTRDGPQEIRVNILFKNICSHNENWFPHLRLHLPLPQHFCKNEKAVKRRFPLQAERSLCDHRRQRWVSTGRNSPVQTTGGGAHQAKSPHLRGSERQGDRGAHAVLKPKCLLVWSSKDPEVSSRDRQRLLRRTIKAHFLTAMGIQPYVVLLQVRHRT